MGPNEGLEGGASRGADEVGVVQSGERLSKLGMRRGALGLKCEERKRGKEAVERQARENPRGRGNG